MKFNGSKFEICWFVMLLCAVTDVNIYAYGFCGILMQIMIMILTTVIILSYQTKGVAESGLLRKVDDNSKTLQKQT